MINDGAAFRVCFGCALADDGRHFALFLLRLSIHFMQKTKKNIQDAFPVSADPSICLDCFSNQ